MSNQPATITYTLPAGLLQVVIDSLMTRPGTETFELLVALRTTCAMQDAERNAVPPLPPIEGASA